MQIRPIRSERDYKEALKEIEKRMGAKANTREGEELDILVTLVDAWEQKHHFIDTPNPVAAILFIMEQRGLSRKDLEQFIGTKSRVQEVLVNKRALTLKMIRNLHSGLGIPADILIKGYI